MDESKFKDARVQIQRCKSLVQNHRGERVKIYVQLALLSKLSFVHIFKLYKCNIENQIIICHSFVILLGIPRNVTVSAISTTLM